MDAVLFRGSLARCREYALVLESKSIDFDVGQSDAGPDLWELQVSSSALHRAYEEIKRYSMELPVVRPVSRFDGAHAGAGYGSAVYALVLLITAYGAGMNAFGADWLAVGALDIAPGFQWWRIFTALTLHADQAHLLGNLLFGMVAGAAVSRLLGAGIGWLSILGAAASANVAEMLIAPSAHRAIGASTAVFAALGLMTGLAWGEGTGHGRSWYRWAPLIAGVCLLTLLGAGAEHVDVLGHLLGFGFGTALGWVYTRHRAAQAGTAHAQALAGACAVLLICAAWAAALRPSP